MDFVNGRGHDKIYDNSRENVSLITQLINTSFRYILVPRKKIFFLVCIFKISTHVYISITSTWIMRYYHSEINKQDNKFIGILFVSYNLRCFADVEWPCRTCRIVPLVCSIREEKQTVLVTPRVIGLARRPVRECEGVSWRHPAPLTFRINVVPTDPKLS